MQAEVADTAPVTRPISNTYAKVLALDRVENK